MRHVAFALMIGLTACSVHWNDDDDGPGLAASGSGTTRTYQVVDFTGVDLKGSDDVDVRVGAGYSVRAEGPSEQLDRLRIGKDGDTLVVGRRSGMSLGRSGPVKIFVTMPRLAAARIAGSGDMAVDRVEGPAFTGNIAGSGNLVIATVAVDRTKLRIAGAGDVTAAGRTGSLGIEIAGSGDIHAPSLTATQAAVSIAGSGNVRARVDGPATVSIMGVGDVDLGPGARCTISKKGVGSVRCG
jgi:hypothetical protein